MFSEMRIETGRIKGTTTRELAVKGGRRKPIDLPRSLQPKRVPPKVGRQIG